MPFVLLVERIKQERWKVRHSDLDTDQSFSSVEEESFCELPMAPSCQDMDNKTDSEGHVDGCCSDNTEEWEPVASLCGTPFHCLLLTLMVPLTHSLTGIPSVWNDASALGQYHHHAHKGSNVSLLA